MVRVRQLATAVQSPLRDYGVIRSWWPQLC